MRRALQHRPASQPVYVAPRLQSMLHGQAQCEYCTRTGTRCVGMPTNCAFAVQTASESQQVVACACVAIARQGLINYLLSLLDKRQIESIREYKSLLFLTSSSSCDILLVFFFSFLFSFSLSSWITHSWRATRIAESSTRRRCLSSDLVLIAQLRRGYG